MGRFTFFDADGVATFGDLFSDSRSATWYPSASGTIVFEEGESSKDVILQPPYPDRL